MNNTRFTNLVDFKSNFLNTNEFHLEKGKNATLILEKFNSDVVKLFLDEDSHLVYITFDKGDEIDTKNLLNATLKKNARLEIYNIVTSDKSSKINTEVHLNESGSSVEIINLLLQTKESTLDSFFDIYHYVGHTSSSLTNYAIAKDNAVVIVNNNATIKQKASSSVAHQATKGLTLSKNAKIKALPNLYIDEYDVIANHACSIGSINKEDLFYLMSRGLTETEASKIVIMGFVKPILDHITNDELKIRIEEEFAKKLR